MEKQVRDFKIDFDFEWTYGISIDKLQADLNKLRELGCTRIDMEPSISYDCPYLEIEAYANRIETDEECQQRIEEEEKRKEELYQRDLQMIEHIKERIRSYGKEA